MRKSPVLRNLPTKALIAVLSLFFIANGVWADPKKQPLEFPSLVLCTQRGHVAHVLQDKIDWEYDGDGQAREIQPQPAEGRVLVVGGPRQVYLLRKVDGGLRVVWDWSGLEGVSIVSAVAADWNLKGEPSLILAGDALGKRLVLAEAKSTGVKIRWQYPLPAQPLKVRVCPDSGNFLVLLAHDALKEIQFQEDKLAWEWAAPQGSSPIQDILRGPLGNTFALQSDGTVFCVKPDKTIGWKTRPPFQDKERRLNQGTLSIFKKKGRHWLMASIHDSRGSGAVDILYLLDTENGKVEAFSDHMGKEVYPPLISAVPDEPFYYRKQ
jgi:hypothetical protein